MTDSSMSQQIQLQSAAAENLNNIVWVSLQQLKLEDKAPVIEPDLTDLSPPSDGKYVQVIDI